MTKLPGVTTKLSNLVYCLVTDLVIAVEIRKLFLIALFLLFPIGLTIVLHVYLG